MARNGHFPHTASRARSLPVPEGTKSGDPVLIDGTLPGVATTDRYVEGSKDYGNGNKIGEATVARDGAWKLPVAGTAAVTNIGTKVYFDAATKGLTTTATGNTLFGYALSLKGAGTATLIVELAQV